MTDHQDTISHLLGMDRQIHASCHRIRRERWVRMAFILRIAHSAMRNAIDLVISLVTLMRP